MKQGGGKRVVGSESLRYVRGERRDCEVCREERGREEGVCSKR